MVYHICQIWGDNMRFVIAAFDNRDDVDAFLLQAKAHGTLRLWGDVRIIEIEGVVTYSPAQWLRSRRVYETVDGLSPGWHRPSYSNEYARSVHEQNDYGLMRYDHQPDTLETDVFPQDHIYPPTGPNWHIRAQIRDWGDDMTSAEWQADKERRAAKRLSMPAPDELELERAIAKLAKQMQPAPPEAAASAPVPSADDQLQELAFEQERDYPIRPVEQRTRPSLNRLSIRTPDELALERAIAKLAKQMQPAPPEAAVSTPVPSADDQLQALTLEQEREYPMRPVEQRTRRSLNRYIEDLPKGRFIDPTQ